MGGSQRGCFNSCCRGSLEDDQFEKDAREKRLKKESGEQETAAAVNSQPKASMEMSASPVAPSDKEEIKMDIPSVNVLDMSNDTPHDQHTVTNV